MTHVTWAGGVSHEVQAPPHAYQVECHEAGSAAVCFTPGITNSFYILKMWSYKGTVTSEAAEPSELLGRPLRRWHLKQT